MKSGKIAGAALAAFITAASGSASAQDKTPVTIGDYCALQATEDQGRVHLDNSPYRNSFVDVPVQSSVHGNITLSPFNCETLIPMCKDGGFAATKGTLSSIHLGLSGLNAGDDPLMVRSLRALGNNIDVLDGNYVENSAEVEHLEGPFPAHGLDLFKKVDGKFEIGETSRALYGACAAELRK